ncbi:MAG: hypothetical protein J7599_01350 [Niabella sp.]|nr:hypothetical protein [Niabella sp.]
MIKIINYPRVCKFLSSKPVTPQKKTGEWRSKAISPGFQGALMVHREKAPQAARILA